MTSLIQKYNTIVFDCDGVLLNSNKVKTAAFHVAAMPWGRRAADQLVEYHVENGGISRQVKFTYLLNEIIPKYTKNSRPGIDGPDMQQLLTTYAESVREGLMTCSVASRLSELRHKSQQSNWCIVSGGDQSELRTIFAERALDHLFDGGIFGSPDSKDIIFSRELENSNIQKPTLFIGDSKYDYQSAKTAGLDFLFMSAWTEVKDWQKWVNQNSIPHILNLEELLKIS